MSAVRIPADPWPFKCHRTWREVLRTEALLSARETRKLSKHELAELADLMMKRVRHNPPSVPVSKELA